MARLIQVTNVSPLASAQNVREIFSYLGDIDEIKVYPEREDKSSTAPAKVGYIKFKDRESCDVALHLTNTVFLDRALIVVEASDDNIPSEELVMKVTTPVSESNAVTNGGTTTGLLPTPSTGTPDVTASVLSVPEQPQVGLVNLVGQAVPPPPPITGNVDPTKIEEIRRTIYVGNLNTNITADQVMSFFNPVGEVKYVRMAGDETQPTRFAFVEFADQASVPLALQYNGAMLGDRPIKVNHSKNAIVKPQAKHPDTAQREMEEAMKKVMEAQQLIDTAIEPGASRSRSGSRSHSNRRRQTRSRSRSHGYGRSRSPRRRRSRSPYYRRSRYSRSPRRRSRSPRRRSRTPRRRSRSPKRLSRSPRRRSRSPRRRSRSPRRRSRSPRRRSRTPRRRSRSPRRRSRSPRRRSRSPRRIRSPRRQSRSPKRRSYSPKKQSYSPKRHSRSPKSRSNSPRIHRPPYSPKESPFIKKQSSSSDDQSPMKVIAEQADLLSRKEEPMLPKSFSSSQILIQKNERSSSPFGEQISPEPSPQPKIKKSTKSLSQSPARDIEVAPKSSHKSLSHQDTHVTAEKDAPGIKSSPHKKHKKRSKMEASSPKPKKHKKHKHHERENSKSLSPVCDVGSDKKRRKGKKKRTKHSPRIEQSPDVLSDS